MSVRRSVSFAPNVKTSNDHNLAKKVLNESEIERIQNKIKRYEALEMEVLERIKVLERMVESSVVNAEKDECYGEMRVLKMNIDLLKLRLNYSL